MSVTAVTLFRFATPRNRFWALWQMLESRWALKRIPDIQFCKMMGSGTRDGFHPYPNFSVFVLLTVWPDLLRAQEAVRHDRVFLRYRERSCEDASMFLETTQVHGQWAGEKPFGADQKAGPDSEAERVAVLTRATLKPQHALSFWRQVPGISEAIAKEKKMLFKIGLGEVPWLHQATFTVWSDSKSMEAFAYQTFHGKAVARVRKGGWFKEELFARFRVLAIEGMWEGVPLFEQSRAQIEREPHPQSIAAFGRP